eukprot:TRINITY_DN3103_c0_g2_i2.p1 TRINITY_DN3103_c0_g2~~TRINITY_DN3103_c0_g2_i2.p1  ORF type:complete len:895 (-),score=183.00 TRINITY_DN3103_c0_g2_i2:695-3379(-)
MILKPEKKNRKDMRDNKMKGELFKIDTEIESEMDFEEDSYVDFEENIGYAEKKQKTKNKIIFNCTGTRYPVVREAAREQKWVFGNENDPWDVLWQDSCFSIDQVVRLEPYQRVNHFIGMSEIARKDNLARNLTKLSHLFPKDYNFVPKTWHVPKELFDFQQHHSHRSSKKNVFYIVKPSASAQGKGIYLISDPSQLDASLLEETTCVVQEYINDPFLINGFKFDLRIYVLVLSVDPLKIYIYDEGLARFATSPFSKVTNENAANLFMHLTNYAINKHNENFIFNSNDQRDDEGSKWSLTAIWKHLKTLNHDVEQIKRMMHDLIVKTIISIQPHLKQEFYAVIGNRTDSFGSFEILGFDILLKEDLKPMLIEVNHSPSFRCDTPLDHNIKFNLINDCMKMLCLSVKQKRKAIMEQRRKFQSRILGEVDENLLENDKKKKKKLNDDERERDEDFLANYYFNPQTFIEKHPQFSATLPSITRQREEYQKKGGWRLLYPLKTNSTFYNQFFIISRPRAMSTESFRRKKKAKFENNGTNNANDSLTSNVSPRAVLSAEEKAKIQEKINAAVNRLYSDSSTSNLKKKNVEDLKKDTIARFKGPRNMFVSRKFVPKATTKFNIEFLPPIAKEDNFTSDCRRFRTDSRLDYQETDSSLTEQNIRERDYCHSSASNVSSTSNVSNISYDSNLSSNSFLRSKSKTQPYFNSQSNLRASSQPVINKQFNNLRDIDMAIDRQSILSSKKDTLQSYLEETQLSHIILKGITTKQVSPAFKVKINKRFKDMQLQAQEQVSQPNEYALNESLGRITYGNIERKRPLSIQKNPQSYVRTNSNFKYEVPNFVKPPIPTHMIPKKTFEQIRHSSLGSFGRTQIQTTPPLSLPSQHSKNSKNSVFRQSWNSDY